MATQNNNQSTSPNWRQKLGSEWKNNCETIRLINIYREFVEILYVDGFSEGRRSECQIDKWERLIEEGILVEVQVQQN